MDPQVEQELQQADQHRINGRYDEALAIYRQLVDADDSLGHAWWGLAHVQMNTGEFEEALENFEKCCALEPANQRYLYDYAMMQTMLSMFDEARELFERCVSIDPTSRTADEARKQLSYL